MTTIRTFIAIELTEEACRAITALQSRLKTLSPPHTIRWTAPQNIHLTLHFLGDIEMANIDKISQAVKATTATYEPFTLSLGQLGCFPNLRRPRIVWIGVWKNPRPLVELHSQLGQALKDAVGFAPETRPYAPHLTIGRLKQGVPSRHVRQFSQVIEHEQAVAKLADLHVTEISLIQSELKSTGAVYTLLSSGRLGG